MLRRKGLTAALLALLLTLIAGGAARADLAAQAAVGDTLPAFGAERSCLGVSASDKWLKQARVGGLPLALRVYDPDGETLRFQEDLDRRSLENKELRLSLRVRDAQDGATLQIDQGAMDVLARVGITEILLCDSDYAVMAIYELSDLQALRDGLALARGEQLCLSGKDAPVTVVSEDGVRRLVAL